MGFVEVEPRSLGSLRLGLKVSGSSSVLMAEPWVELTSSLVVICRHDDCLASAAEERPSPVSAWQPGK
ncbi:hypothetical protein CRUP_019343 [Coryphaenoides rupestris]|nr:hypothetical protein CRUP_019343 [Coryphaenoides rupestris]